MFSRPADLRTKIGFRLLVLAGALLPWLGLLMTPPMARAERQSEVTVDMGVLNSLGNSGSGSAHRIHLHPPRGDRHQTRSATHKTAKKKSRHSHRQAAKRHGHAKRTAHAKAGRKREATASSRKEAGRKRTDRRHHETKLRRAEIESKTDLQAPPPKPETVVPSPSDLRKQVIAPAPILPPPPTTATATPKAMPEPPPAKPGPVAAASPPAAPPARTAPPAAQPAAIEKSHSVDRVAAHVDFAAGTADLSPEARGALDAVAKSLAADADRRLQLVAYATGANDEANQARRLSLSRALNVRAYLIDHGVRNTRMDVRALGNRPDDGKPADRVDILFVDK